LWKLIGKGARFPVDTPPTLLDWGRFNCTKDQSIVRMGQEQALPERRLYHHS
jgi:hypothetical protein